MPLRLYQFPTGVRCLRLADIDSHKLCENTLEEVRQKPHGCTFDSFSLSLNLPLAVGRERLLNAESVGFLCRDESPSGVFFYPNRFLQYDTMIAF